MNYNVMERQPAMAPPPPRVADAPRVNWWLRLTSSGWETPPITVEQREFARRSRLTSWIILALLVMELVLLPAGVSVPSTLVAVAVAVIGTIIAAVLNRAGFVTLAGSLLVLLLSGAILGSIVGAQALPCKAGTTCSPFVTAGGNGQISLIYLPAYDLLTISVIVGASILPRASAFVIAIGNIALIIADFALQAHAADVNALVAYEGALPLIARPIGLQIIIATIAYLWVRGTDQAIRRADRAEELAAMEHAIAEQKRQLDVGVQQLLQTHIRAANGDFSARAPLGQDNVLWQVAASLNNLLSRLQKSGQAEHQLRRTEDELRRVAAALDDANAGRRPLWPATSGTAADMIIERIVRGGGPRSQMAYPPAPDRGFQDRGYQQNSGPSMMPPNPPQYGSGPLLPGANPMQSPPLPAISQFPPSNPQYPPSNPQFPNTGNLPREGYPPAGRPQPQQQQQQQPNPWAFPFEPEE